MRVPTEEEETPHAHRAAVEDEPRAVLDSYRRRLHTFDLPLSRVAWAGAMALFGLALVLRLWGLGSIDELIFDETYYVKDGYDRRRAWRWPGPTSPTPPRGGDPPTPTARTWSTRRWANG